MRTFVDRYSGHCLSSENSKQDSAKPRMACSVLYLCGVATRRVTAGQLPLLNYLPKARECDLSWSSAQLSTGLL